MSTPSISPARVGQINKTVQSLLSAFDRPIGSDQTQEQFTAVFNPEIQWRDHAFLVRRVGYEAVLGLHKAWLHCNQPFKTNIKAIHPTPDGCVTELVWVGRQANDIVRPNGEVAVQASGKDFICHVCMVLRIDESGQIQEIDEYYNKQWDNGIAEEQYAAMKGASIKANCSLTSKSL